MNPLDFPDETTPPPAAPSAAAPVVVDFAVYDTATGKVLRAGWMMDEASALAQAGAGEAVYLGLVLPQHYVGANGPVAVGEAPSADHVYDWARHAWQLRGLEEMRTAASARIDAAYSAATSAISAGYPLEERESWPVQASEARALLADPDAATPWITAAAHARGLTSAALAQRILALDDAYRAMHGQLSGTRQQLQKQIAAATTPQDLSLAVWPSHLEGTP
jgi:hypothetical protein